MAAELLTAYVENTDILGDGTTIAMNRDSGYVFLTDEDYRVVMMNGNKLEEFFSCGECGHEGFREEFVDSISNHGNTCEECSRISRQGYFGE